MNMGQDGNIQGVSVSSHDIISTSSPYILTLHDDGRNDGCRNKHSYIDICLSKRPTFAPREECVVFGYDIFMETRCLIPYSVDTTMQSAELGHHG